MNRKDAFL